jgi:hypothetical protein
VHCLHDVHTQLLLEGPLSLHAARKELAIPLPPTMAVTGRRRVRHLLSHFACLSQQSTTVQLRKEGERRSGAGYQAQQQAHLNRESPWRCLLSLRFLNAGV